jgi:hypothetical protein
VPALDSNLAAPTRAHRRRPALSLLLALAAGVLAVAVVRGATSEARLEEPERKAADAPRAPDVSKGATVTLARRAFPAH